MGFSSTVLCILLKNRQNLKQVQLYGIHKDFKISAELLPGVCALCSSTHILAHKLPSKKNLLSNLSVTGQSLSSMGRLWLLVLLCFPPLHLNCSLDQQTLAPTGFLWAILCRSGHLTCPSDTTEPFHGFQSQLVLITPWPPGVFLFSSCD